MARTYRILKNVGREVGPDWLICNFKGLSFIPPVKTYMQPGDTIFEADLKTCRTLAAKIGACCPEEVYVVDNLGNRV